MLFLTNFQHVNGSFMKKTDTHENWWYWRKWSFGHLVGKQFSSKTSLTTLDFYFVAFLILLTAFFFSKEFYHCMFVQFLLDFSSQKVCFAQVLAFSKVAKIEGEVFVTLRASQGDLKPSRATISPQSPRSLIPDIDLEIWILFFLELCMYPHSR